MTGSVEVDVTTRRRITAVDGGVTAVGSVLLTTSSLLQQRQDIPRGEALGVLSYIDARPWSAAALLAVLGTLCWAAALPGIGRCMASPVARATARLAGPALVVATAVFAVEQAHDGSSSVVLSRRWSDGQLDAAAAAGDQRVVEVLVGGTSMLAQTLLGLALTVFALATLLDRQYPRLLSWVGLVGALGWFVTGAALFLDLPGSSFLLVLPFSTLSSLWLLALGLVLVGRGVARGARPTQD